ncbi:DNA recombination protein RmuC [hydrothermal vent metagenome]|uniref:DNA recombination protein RmuC n=1 Tax=hydrothermal vent metagenome TaxID=652676 RepID=A0A3B1C9V0_9ZZZZ
MDWWLTLVIFIVGFLFGLGVAFVLRLMQSKNARQLAQELFSESEMRRKENVDAIVESLKSSFGNLSFEALSKSTEEFLKLASKTLGSEREINVKELDTKKGLIDQQLERMAKEMEKVSTVVKELEKDRVEKFGELATQLKSANDQTSALIKTTSTLNEALASSQVRGQWGERMAEDVLRLAGFIENVNYLKQKTIGGTRDRPDFTFLLPNDRKVNMDVKFPFDNYRKFFEADSDSEKEKFRKDFLKDVKNRIKEVVNSDYINPEQNTLDYVILFIPNEQIYSFIHEQDSSIMDEGIKNKVVFCSPITLFAVLAVIRQAVDNFNLEQTSNEILSLFGAFKKQWDRFVESLEAVGKKIEAARTEYNAVMTTRRNALEKPLEKIESLRSQQELPIAAMDGGDEEKE